MHPLTNTPHPASDEASLWAAEPGPSIYFPISYPFPLGMQLFISLIFSKLEMKWKAAKNRTNMKTSVQVNLSRQRQHGDIISPSQLNRGRLLWACAPAFVWGCVFIHVQTAHASLTTNVHVYICICVCSDTFSSICSCAQNEASCLPKHTYICRLACDCLSAPMQQIEPQTCSHWVSYPQMHFNIPQHEHGVILNFTGETNYLTNPQTSCCQSGCINEETFLD